jgi:hypothetical protein
MAQITLSGSIGHFNPVLSIIDILDAQGGMRTVPTFTNGALTTEFAGIPNKVKQFVSSIIVQDTSKIYYLSGLTASDTGSWTPLNYITQDPVLEFANLASFPPVGAVSTIYIALDTGFAYSWNGSAYIPIASPATGISGLGTTNRIAKFTSSTVIGDSNISDTGTGGAILINVGGTASVRVNTALTIGNTTFPAGGNTILSLSRTQSYTGFILGNPDVSQISTLDFNNYFGSAVRSTAYLQIGASSGVYFTTGATLSTTTTYQDNTGSWGFGTTATSFAKLNVLSAAISGRESIMSVQVSDNADDRYILSNGTATTSRFIPAHTGFVGGTYSSFIFRGLGLVANDSGNEPYIQFRVANTSSSTDPNNGTLTNVVNRPMFTWGSVNESMRMLANGNLGLGTSLPDTKLHVAALNDIAKFEYTNLIGLSAGDNFLFNSGIFGDDISLQSTRGLHTTRIIGYNSNGQSYFNDESIISYPDQSIRMNGETTFAKTITYELPASPILATGEIVYFGLSSVALVPGDIYYYATNEEWEPADTGAHGNKLLGIPLGATVTDGILVKGFAKFPGNSNYSGFVNNSARQYLNSTPGSFSEVGPTVSGETVRIIGYCVNTDTLYFSPDTTWVVIL